MRLIDDFIRRNNRFADTYRIIRDVMQPEKEMADECVPMVNMVLKRNRRSDPRRFNTPTGNEIAMIFVSEPPFDRYIPINPQDASKPFINIF
ncbi:hypothetical protein J437_LFUL016350 [Ladona fulva]|uniref:Uncharacterized protein n=1 Tax=Ladona fulva TaxID=123851 RepID=A0A8K0P637_LADFU|nr:hypothetical protein J437_LFUL016350 [Ladona fulva]